METASDIKLGVFGALGALAPDIILLYSKRFTMPSVAFSGPMFAAATLLYVGLAAVVAAIYPYGQRRSPLFAMGVGLALPVVLSSVATLIHTSPIVTRGMQDNIGTFADLLRLW